MNGVSARPLRRWIIRATSSFPVPLSPVIRTVEWVGAARSIVSRRLPIDGASPIIR